MTDYVNIIACNIGGPFFVEGRARVVKTIDDENKLVDFEDGYGPVERFVDPLAQGDDLDAYVAKLNATWK